jgi:hypothetical protein
MAIRNPLHNRKWPLADDVRLAICHIHYEDEKNGGGLPLAIRRKEIAEKLVEMHHTDDEGIIDRSTHGRILMDCTRERFVNYIKTSQAFYNGYKLYEETHHNPVVPVTDYFFDKLYLDGETRGYLEAMDLADLKQSLPSRTVRMARDGNDDLVRASQVPGYRPVTRGTVDDTYVEYESGKVAGICVFPHGSKSQLSAAWADRCTIPSGVGAINSVSDKLINIGINPDAVAALAKGVVKLDPPVEDIKGAMTRRLAYVAATKKKVA